MLRWRTINFNEVRKLASRAARTKLSRCKDFFKLKMLGGSQIVMVSDGESSFGQYLPRLPSLLAWGKILSMD